VTTSTPQKSSPFAFGWKIFSSLKSPVYRIYFFATIAHFAAMSMQIVSSPYLIFHLTNSPALLGTMSLVNAAPMIFVSMFGGALADRLRKKSILIAGMCCLSFMSLVIGLSLATGVLNSQHPASWWILIGSSFIQGCIMGLMMPAIQAIIPELVNRDQLMNAIAMNTLGMTSLNLLAPVAAGYIIGENANYQTVYFVMTGFYLLALCFIMFLPKREKPKASGTKILADISEGFKYIRKDKLIQRILVFTLAVVILAMPFQQLMPIFTDDILKVGPPGMGLLMSISGAGALIGSFFLAIMPGKKRGLMLLLSGIVAGLSLTVFSFSSIMGVSMVVIFFIGMSQAFRNTIGGALLQTYTENAYMGRVMSIMNMQWGLMSICTFLAGILAGIVPVQWVLGSLSMLLVILSLIFLGTFKNVRKVE
jgi:MFS family permease